MSYGGNLGEIYERAAALTDRILQGAIPAELPFEQPTRYDLVINLKAAKAIGLDVPFNLLARADEVIESATVLAPCLLAPSPSMAAMPAELAAVEIVGRETDEGGDAAEAQAIVSVRRFFEQADIGLDPRQATLGEEAPEHGVLKLFGLVFADGDVLVTELAPHGDHLRIMSGLWRPGDTKVTKTSTHGRPPRRRVTTCPAPPIDARSSARAH